MMTDHQMMTISPTPIPLQDTSANKKRSLPYRERAAQPPAMAITDRDIRVLADLDKYRFLTVDQLEVLEFFSPARTLAPRCKARLQKLFHHGFVARVRVDVVMGEGRKPTIYSIDERGIQLLAETQENKPAKITWLTDGYRSKDEGHLDHDIALNNFWAVVERLSRDGHFQFVEGMTAYKFKSRKMSAKVPFVMHGKKVTKKEPDAYFALKFADRSMPFHFFCEQDQGTKSKNYWQDKVKAYIHFRSGGLSDQHYGTRFFRVLTKTPNPRRMEKLIQWTQEAGGDDHFWFITEDKLNIWQPTTFLDPIWRVVGKDGMHPLNVPRL